jgi:hypothetical protein
VSRRCKDCVAAQRPGKPLAAPYPGPRCHTHHHINKRAVADREAARRRAKVYGLTAEDYQILLAEQDYKCAWCRRPVRKDGRRLAVDHDHSCCPGHLSCGECVRGLLCWTCNKAVHHLGDAPETVERGAAYLRNPPARVALSMQSR